MSPGSKVEYNDEMMFTNALNAEMLYAYPGEMDPAEQRETIRDLLAYIFRIWFELGPAQQKVFAARVLYPELTHTQLAKKLKISRNRLYSIYRRIAQKWPEMKEYLER